MTEVVNLARETRSSIELKLSAKGEYHWEIKVYFEDGHADEALAVLDEIDTTLRRDYLGDA